MRFALVALVVLLLAATGLGYYPPVVEGTDDACGALEQRVGDLASRDSAGRLIVSPLYGSSASAPSGAAFVRDRYPLLPRQAGCALAYWRTVVDPSLVPPPQALPPPEPPATPVPAAAAGPVPVIARGVTPNGDPISPETVLSQPVDSVAIRLDYPPGGPKVGRFQLRQGRAVLASCVADRAPSGAAWCRFAVSLRKGNYAIAALAGNAVLGQYVFTVIGR